MIQTSRPPDSSRQPEVLRSLRASFTRILTLTLAILMIAVLAAIYFSARSNQSRHANDLLDTVIEEGSSISRPLDAPDIGQISLPFLYVQMNPGPSILTAGNLYDEYSQAAVMGLIERTLALETERGILEEDQLRFLVVQDSFVLRFAYVDMSAEQATLRSLLLTLIVVGLVSLAVFVVLARFLAERAVRPVAQAMQQQKQFIEDASHELKTPLAVLKADLSLLKQRRDETIGSQSRWLDSMEKETDNMSELVGELLFLARLENPDTSPALEPVNLSKLADEAVLSFESLAFESGKGLDLSAEVELWVQGDVTQLRRLLQILIENALKHGAPDGAVQVSLQPTPDKKVRLAVNNPGEPIPEDQLQHLFDRFYRADAARDRAGGSGLGLAIAEAIAAAHGSEITVTSDAVTGTTFAIELPRLRPGTQGE